MALAALLVVLLGVGYIAWTILIRLEEIGANVHQLHHQGRRLVSLSSELIAEVAEVKGVLASTKVLIEKGHAKILELLDAGDVAAARAALVDLKNASDEAAAAVAANPIPEDVPPVEPTP